MIISADATGGVISNITKTADVVAKSNAINAKNSRPRGQFKMACIIFGKMGKLERKEAEEAVRSPKGWIGGVSRPPKRH